ncbi:MAG: hypothetical protein CMO66_07240 [Verrucomicrobiales bacterium]|nr:hypothetical protein [Verrucomicrobiales bacterium]
MDRSFLADKNVIAASKQYVCIRLATYEDAVENEVLKGIFAPGGILQNTVFSILSPDGRTSLIRAGRSPAWAFGGKAGRGIHEQPPEAIAKMAQTMNVIALAYPGKNKPKGRVPLPYLADFRLALNVAAADRLPLMTVFGDALQRSQIEQRLEPLAWSSDFLGRALYVPVTKPETFKVTGGVQSKAGVVVIQPGVFGLNGKVIREIAPDISDEQLKQSLVEALGRHQPSELSYEEHRRQGAAAGKRWESKTPNTDGQGRRRFGPGLRR